MMLKEFARLINARDNTEWAGRLPVIVRNDEGEYEDIIEVTEVIISGVAALVISTSKDEE